MGNFLGTNGQQSKLHVKNTITKENEYNLESEHDDDSEESESLPSLNGLPSVWSKPARRQKMHIPIDTDYLDLTSNMDFQIKTITEINEDIIEFVYGYFFDIMNNRNYNLIPIEVINLIILYTFNMEYFTRHGRILDAISIQGAFDTI